MKINTKTTGIILIVAVMIIGVTIISGCGKKIEQGHITNSVPKKPLIEEESLKCAVGSYAIVAGAKYKITGVEKHTLAGKTMDLCCSEVEVEVTGEAQKIKNCADMTNMSDYIITWQSNEETNREYKKVMEVYQQGDQQCQKIFDPQENALSESCQ